MSKEDSKSKDAADLEYTQDLISNLLGTFKDKNFMNVSDTNFDLSTEAVKRYFG